MTSTHSALLEPLQVGHHTFRNRVVVTAHATFNIDEDHLPDDRDVAYFRERALGGAALVTMGTTVVHLSSPQPYGVYRNTDDDIVPRYEALTSAVHEHGALMVPQLGHMGARNDGHPGPLWGPSRFSHHAWGRTSHEMNEREIAEVIDAYVAAARRAMRGGMDGVELAVGHGQLINLFLSPLTNRRTDQWGGSDDNRYRFAREVISGVREAIGDDALLIARVNGSDETEGSLDLPAWADICARLSDDGLVDAINVSSNFNGSVIPTFHMQTGCYLPYAAEIRKHVSVPVGAVGRINAPHIAESALANGEADFVGMTRAHIADPHLVTKLAAGRTEQIRPCIACVQMCQGELHRGRNVKCVYNPITGREAERRAVETTQVARPRHVVVVGGGPAGLETARVAATRGHRVTLFEQADEVGGTLRRVAAIPGQQEFGEAIGWLEREVRRLGVQVRVGAAPSASDIGAVDPDCVVLATGASTALPRWLDPADDRHLGVRELVADAAGEGRVVVVDDDTYGQGVAASLAAASRGCEVTVLTDRSGIAEDLEPERRDDVLAAVTRLGIRVVTSVRVTGLSADGVQAANVYSGELTSYPADRVASTWTAPNDQLAAELPQDLEVHYVGDVEGPHRLEAAVHRAFLLAARL